jgi:hypothetical protein
MRTFSFCDIDGTHVITDAEIIRDYFPYWSGKMKEVGKEDLINHANCIDDFCVLHWASEILGDDEL